MTKKQPAASRSVSGKAQGTRPTRPPPAERGNNTSVPKRTTPSEGQPHPRVAHSPTWRLEEAKAKFSEVVRRAHEQGPQYVTVRGKPAVAIIDAAELERLLPMSPGVVPLVQFLESLHMDGLDLTRDRDGGRDVVL